MHRIYKPIIGAINGWALAGGLETAMACDIRIASERAMFGSFEARRGFHHGDGGLVRLVNTCGVGVAMQMLLTAEPIDAQRALQCNMVTKVVPHEKLMEEAELVARQILRNSQAAVRSAKQTILDVIGQPLDFQLRTEAWNAYTCADPEETKELLERFYEKTDAGRAGSHETALEARRSRPRLAPHLPQGRAAGGEVELARDLEAVALIQRAAAQGARLQVGGRALRVEGLERRVHQLGADPPPLPLGGDAHDRQVPVGRLARMPALHSHPGAEAPAAAASRTP